MKRPARTLRTLAALGVIAAAGPAPAAQICRWVDESGRTQISDVVPDRYKRSAQCTDSRAYELSPEDRQRAQERAAREKTQPERSDRGAAPVPGPAPASSAPPAKRPAQGVDETTDCETWWRLYDESEACFGPYRTARGATKAEAFDRCTVIPRPEPKCGPRRH